MRLIEGQPPYPPRACAKTNRIDGDFIDFQVLIDRPGRLYLKREVVESAAELCGMVPASEVVALEERLKSLSAELQHTQEIMINAAELEELISRERIAA